MAKLKYDVNSFPLLAEGWARDGLSDAQIAENLGISRQSFYLYQKKYPDFYDAIKRGKIPVDVKVENSLLKRALGYDYEETVTEIKKDAKKNIKETHIKKTTKHVAPDVTAQIFWLKNRKPKEWRDRKELDHTTNGNELKGFTVVITDDDGNEREI